jgi:hypothetical protein
MKQTSMVKNWMVEIDFVKGEQPFPVSTHK